MKVLSGSVSFDGGSMKGAGLKKIGLLAVALLFMIITSSPVSNSLFAADSLVVKDSGGTSTFKVEDDGKVFTTARYTAQSESPGFWLDETGTGGKGAFFVLDEGWIQVQRRSQGFGGYEASPIFINIGAPGATFSITVEGNVGIGKYPASHPLHMGSGAYCSTGGTWTDASSREYKENIETLTAHEAVDTLKELRPVKFRYKNDPEDKHVGFIAEDVPDLVASKDRKGMSSMDVVAVLTKVVQEQQKTIADLSRKVAELEKKGN